MAKRPLSDFIKITHGFAFAGEHFTETPTADVLVTPGNFAIGGGFKLDRPKFYNGPVPDEYVLPAGELVVTMTDLSKQGDTLGYPAIIPVVNGLRFLHNQRIGRVLAKPGAEIERRYLYYLMCSREYRHEIVAGATGTTVKHTAPTRIEAFKWAIPPLPTQRAIAGVLGALDDKIEVNRRMARTLEAAARALFESWFIRFEHPGGNGAAPRLADSPMGPIPAGWTVRPLDTIARFLNGLALQKFPPKDGEPTLPVIKIAQLRKGDTAGADLANTDIPADYMVNDRDLLFSWSGSLECVLWTGGPGALNQHLFKVTSTEFPRWFLYLWVQHHLPEFRHIAAAKATTMGHIQRHHLTQALVAVPPATVLAEMDRTLGPMIDAIPQRLIQARTLAEARDALLPRLISGEFEIPAALLKEAAT